MTDFPYQKFSRKKHSMLKQHNLSASTSHK